MSRYYPLNIKFHAQHSDVVTPHVMAEEYMTRLRQIGLHEITSYSISGMDGDRARGTHSDLIGAIDERERRGADAGYFMMNFGPTKFGDVRVSFTRNQGGRPFWYVESKYPPETRPMVEWMRRMADLGMLVPTAPGFDFAVIWRQQTWAKFVPEPPQARAFHLVTTNEREIANEYDNPDFFWKVWDRVETVGDTRVCIRALEALDEVSWLDETFESTMELVRLAKPKLTNYRYRTASRTRPEFAPWWEYGDFQAEKAGEPALFYVGYEAATRTVEYAGFITTPPHERPGEDSRRHVLIREIHGLRALIEAKQDAKGRPVETVRIVFPFEWMARQERRPLLDAGARVFFQGGDLVEIVD